MAQVLIGVLLTLVVGGIGFVVYKGYSNLQTSQVNIAEAQVETEATLASKLDDIEKVVLQLLDARKPHTASEIVSRIQPRANYAAIRRANNSFNTRQVEEDAKKAENTAYESER